MNDNLNKKTALALDTSTPVASVAIAQFDDISKKLLYSSMLNIGLTHSQTAAKMIDSALSYTNIKPSDIDMFAVVNGPGSFTGLRIGIATMAALADSQDKPLITISTLQALAHNIRYFNSIIVPVIDARRTNVYGAVFSGSDCKQLLDDSIYDIGELTEKVREVSSKAIFVGDGTFRHSEAITSLMENAVIAKDNDNLVNAQSALNIAIDRYLNGDIDNKLVNYVKATSAIPQSQQKKKW